MRSTVLDTRSMIPCMLECGVSRVLSNRCCLRVSFNWLNTKDTSEIILLYIIRLQIHMFRKSLLYSNRFSTDSTEIEGIWKSLPPSIPLHHFLYFILLFSHCCSAQLNRTQPQDSAPDPGLWSLGKARSCGASFHARRVQVYGRIRFARVDVNHS